MLILVACFTGQLKGWCDNYLTYEQKTQELNTYRIHECEQSIKDENGQIIQDAVNTLIFSISQYFIGDHLHIRYIN